jgi:hypothetical protein
LIRRERFEIVGIAQPHHPTDIEPLTNPGIETDSPGGPTIEVIDPFSNTIRFCQKGAQSGIPAAEGPL